ncbi:terminase TerL endonuclease subunit [Asticcacaulis excentricus]|uniref:Terminase n=1 Tax=Asticcacaulis excentricus (strain ATCC 15261 / DSM 4724 / KCTC 12464 / NCIMB 9791 / VKM B-1370 / CB 48) TaxID=573065 RepID=E8RPP9_ASTEC|nr:terminase TerL endonuclease subunit [Asticcacaulis excentricus]ADU12026.1 Terminase [Asticcacaulis excentricus CB 48]
MWDLSCPDWEDRIRNGRSLIPDLPLNAAEAEMAVAIFGQLQLPDVPDQPKMVDACGPWFIELVRVVFGSWFPDVRKRMIRDFFAMLPKGQSKTTYSAGLMITGMIMNRRPNAEALFVAPTQRIADTAYEKAAGMIEASSDLKRRFRTRDHQKKIEDLSNGSELCVKTFDVNILTGAILFMAMVDELHLLGKNQHTTKVLRQIRGGLEKTPEGLLLFTTTQSDEQPVGAFKSELKLAKRIRDGHMRDRIIRPMLPILYEFPPDIAAEEQLWSNPENWSMVMPNLGRSVHLDSLVEDWHSEKEKGIAEVKIWASQHLNIEIGVGISDDGWRGADYWEEQADPTLTLQEVIRRSEVCTIGIDGGGLDDLLGISVMGRERETRKWLMWNHAFANPSVKEIRKDIVANLEDFEEEGSLTFAKVPNDVELLVDIVVQVYEAGLLPKEKGIGIDPNNIAAIIEELLRRGIPDELIFRLRQGVALAPALFGLERKLSDGTLIHSGLTLMNWCVGNAKVIITGNSPMITKQISGRAKIDPLVASFCATILLSWNPEAFGRSVYEDDDDIFI